MTNGCRQTGCELAPVACDDNGVSSFDLVRHHRANESIFLYAFDLIELNGDDLRRDPLALRAVCAGPAGA
jgi:ATP-dependent DNA ligase